MQLPYLKRMTDGRRSPRFVALRGLLRLLAPAYAMLVHEPRLDHSSNQATCGHVA